MAVFREDRKGNFTITSNHHLKERGMSLKAIGLFAIMLSLRDDWDYSLNGLVAIRKESETAIKSAIAELKKFGYLETRKTQNEKGQFVWEYNIFESPRLNRNETQEKEVGRVEPKAKADFLDTTKNENEPNPYPENPPMDNPAMDNRTQLSTKELITKESNTTISKKVCKGHSEGMTVGVSEPLIFEPIPKKESIFQKVTNEHGEEWAQWALGIVDNYIDKAYLYCKNKEHPNMNKAQRMAFAGKLLDCMSNVTPYEHDSEYDGLSQDNIITALNDILNNANCDPTILYATSPTVLGYWLLRQDGIEWDSLKNTIYEPVETYYG